MRLIFSMPFVLFAIHALAMPLQDYRDNNNNAYGGAGGQASGGSVIGDASHGHSDLLGFPVLNILSNNGGDGGDAGSGDALGGRSRSNGYSPKDHNSGNAYSGNGGHAAGGSVNGVGGLINILSNNAGDGGTASSGSSQGGGQLWRRSSSE